MLLVLLWVRIILRKLYTLEIKYEKCRIKILDKLKVRKLSTYTLLEIAWTNFTSLVQSGLRDYTHMYLEWSIYITQSRPDTVLDL